METFNKMLGLQMHVLEAKAINRVGQTPNKTKKSCVNLIKNPSRNVTVIMMSFDLVSRSGLSTLLQKIGCPPHLLAVITPFHDNMHSTVCCSGATSQAFPVSSGVKQGCVLARTLFGIFFSMLFQRLQGLQRGCIYIHTRSDDKLCSLARLRAKTKVTEVLISELHFALTSHTEDGLHPPLPRLQGVWTNLQPGEDQHHCAGHRNLCKHRHGRIHSGSR